MSHYQIHKSIPFISAYSCSLYSGVMMTPKGRREAMGFTQTALAERIGIAQSHYGQIELGKTRAKPETRRWMDGAGRL